MLSTHESNRPAGPADRRSTRRFPIDGLYARDVHGDELLRAAVGFGRELRAAGLGGDLAAAIDRRARLGFRPCRRPTARWDDDASDGLQRRRGPPPPGVRSDVGCRDTGGRAPDPAARAESRAPPDTASGAPPAWSARGAAGD